MNGGVFAFSEVGFGVRRAECVPINAVEHHKRLERPAGKYFTADTANSYRVIDFHGNSQGKLKAVDVEDRSHHVIVWVSAEGNISIETPGYMERDSLPFVPIDQVVTANKKR